MNDRIDRRKFLGAAEAAAAAGPAQVFAQPPNPGERNVDPINLPLDKPGIWTFNFRYKTPRIITVPMIDRFDKNKRIDKTIWYMFFQVYNRTGTPEVFLPKFILRTRDLNTVHLDEPQPFMIEHIRKLEDPESVLKPPIQSTVDISRRPIPVTPPDAIPRLVSGAAVWTDMAEKAPKTNQFSVFITGLSNGLATEEEPDKRKFLKEKVLRIDFIRPTDDANPNPTDIRLDMSNNQPETWFYRTIRPVDENPKKKVDNQ